MDLDLGLKCIQFNRGNLLYNRTLKGFIKKAYELNFI
jgi:hypothetical protein